MNGPPDFVLDSTALIALVTLEPGHEKVEEILDRSAVGAVSLAESVHKLIQKGSSPHIVETMLRGLKLQVVEWSADLAYLSSEYTLLGKSHGLSLGDRACLTLAKHLGAQAVTADRGWKAIRNLRVPILFFR